MTSEIFKKNYIVSEDLLKVNSKIKLTINEFIILMYFINDEQKKLDIDSLSSKVFIKKEEILSVVNSLLEKELISLSSKKDSSGKIADYISIDGLARVINDNIKSKEKNNTQGSVFDIFEKEFGRTLSSMEYDIINSWIEKNISEELIIKALQEAIYNGVTNLRYIDKILYEWNKKGLKNSKDVDDHIKKRKNASDNKDLFDYNWLEDEE